jgi:hypothetical protein
MHDGSVPTLEAIVDLYDRGGIDRPSRDAEIHPLGLSADERADLQANPSQFQYPRYRANPFSKPLPAPPRFSTITLCFQISESRCATAQVNTSVNAPAAEVTTTVTLRPG